MGRRKAGRLVQLAACRLMMETVTRLSWKFNNESIWQVNCPHLSLAKVPPPLQFDVWVLLAGCPRRLSSDACNIGITHLRPCLSIDYSSGSSGLGKNPKITPKNGSPYENLRLEIGFEQISHLSSLVASHLWHRWLQFLRLLQFGTL